MSEEHDAVHFNAPPRPTIVCTTKVSRRDSSTVTPASRYAGPSRSSKKLCIACSLSHTLTVCQPPSRSPLTRRRASAGGTGPARREMRHHRLELLLRLARHVDDEAVKAVCHACHACSSLVFRLHSMCIRFIRRVANCPTMSSRSAGTSRNAVWSRRGRHAARSSTLPSAGSTSTATRCRPSRRSPRRRRRDEDRLPRLRLEGRRVARALEPAPARRAGRPARSPSRSGTARCSRSATRNGSFGSTRATRRREASASRRSSR